MIKEQLLAVFIGGGMGSVARFLLSSFAQRTAGGNFPWGTLTVNLVGCFIIGILWAVSGKVSLPFTLSLFLFAGLLGGFTTFSSFGIETFALLHDGAWRPALIYAVSTNILGLFLAYAGFAAATFLLD